MPSVDIDTESDNTLDIDRSDWEEQIENKQDHAGKIIRLNNDDDNLNDGSDMDEIDFSGRPAVFADRDDDLVQAILDFGIDNYEGLADDTLRLAATGGLRIWGDQQRNFPEGAVCVVNAFGEEVSWGRWKYPVFYHGHDKRAPPKEPRRDVLVTSVYWDWGGTSFCTRNKHSQRSPVGAIHELPLPGNSISRKTCGRGDSRIAPTGKTHAARFGGTCLSGPFINVRS